MTRLPSILLGIALAAGAVPAGADPGEARYDLLVRNGVVYDGSGAPPQRLDVAVRGDRVVALLPPGAPAAAGRVLDAAGQGRSRRASSTCSAGPTNRSSSTAAG